MFKKKKIKTYARFHLVSCGNLRFLENFLYEVLKRFFSNDIYPLVKKYTIRNKNNINTILDSVKRFPGIVIYSLNNTEFKKIFERRSHYHSIRIYDPLDHLSFHIEDFFNLVLYEKDPYIKKVFAFDFNQKHDDGLGMNDIDNADVIITGVSRTSKTPTCLYLANYGIKAANIPYIDEDKIQNIILEKSKKVLLVALYSDIMSNIYFRRGRLSDEEGGGGHYIKSVEKEMKNSLSFFKKNKIYCINVTYKNIEDTSRVIISLLRENGKRDYF